MCVAVILDPGAELSFEEVCKMANANADGVGLAWATGDTVEWWKATTYSYQYAHKVINDFKESPRLLHFRLSTVGGIRPELCHPFEIGPMASAASRGHGQEVLIHNGHWSRWKDIFDILKEEGALPDAGPWSDSRLAAFLAHMNREWLTTVTGRVATLSADGDISVLGDWKKLREGVFVSNNLWDHSYNYRRSGRDREWEGWGWTEQEWKEKMAHQAAKEKEKANAEKKDSGGEGVEKDPEKAGGIKNGVAVEPRDRAGSSGLTSTRTDQGGSTNGVRNSGVSEGGADHGKEKDEEEIKRLYNFKPWHNKTNNKWYGIDPSSVTRTSYRVVEVPAEGGGQAVEQSTPAAGQEGG